MKKILAITAASAMILGLCTYGSAGEALAAAGGDSFEMFQEAATITETVLVDEANVKITAKALTYDSYSATLSLTLENNTDKNLSFYSTSYDECWNSINGVMADFYMSETVNAGKKANVGITLYADDLMEMGISDIADIEISFVIEDSETYDEYLRTGMFQIPTSIADSYVYPEGPALAALTNAEVMSETDLNTVYYSDEAEGEGDVTVAAKWMGTDWSDYTVLKYEINNASDQRVVIRPTAISFNGLYASVSSSDTYISPGKKGIIEMTVDYMVDYNVRTWVGLEEIGKVVLNYDILDESKSTLIGSGAANIEIEGAATEAAYEGIELVNENGIRIEGIAVTQENSDYSPDVYFIFVAENNSGKDLEFSTSYNESSVNGFMTSLSSNYPVIPDGGKGLFILTLYDWYFADCDIESYEDVEEMETVVEAYDYDTYNTVLEAPIGLYFTSVEEGEEELEAAG